MSYSVVLWDWNGTIFDDVELCYNIYQEFVRKYSLQHLSISEYRANYCFPLLNFLKRCGFKGDFYELAHDFKVSYEQGICSCSLQPGVTEFIEQLHANGVEQHVISAHNSEDLMFMVDSFNLTHYFSSVNGLADGYGVTKLNLAKTVAHSNSLHDKDTLFIGDTLHDYDVAQSIGSDTWLIARGHVSHERLAQCDNARTFSSLNGIASQFDLVI